MSGPVSPPVSEESYPESHADGGGAAGSSTTELGQARPVVAHGRLAVLRRLGWGVVDQGVSSVSNFAMGVLVAHALGPQGFGAFTLAYVTYGVVLNAARGLATDPLLVRHSGPETATWRVAVGQAAATGTLVGVACGVVCLGLGLVIGGPVGIGFVALGVGLPGLMLQDAWRFAFFSSGHAGRAVVNDGIWSLLQLAVIAFLFVTGTASVGWCVLAFGATAGIAGLIGIWQVRVRPHFGGARTWVTRNFDLGGRYLVENVAISGARQLRFVILGGAASLAAVGQVRAAEMLLGPFLVILMGMSQVAVPEASHLLKRSPERLGRFCAVFSLSLVVGCSLWGLVMYLLLPHGLGELLLGSLWQPARAVLPFVTMGMCMAACEVGAAAGIRALGKARRSLRAQLWNSGLYLLGGGLGAYVGGARGTAIGVTLATAVGAWIWWSQLARARAEARTEAIGAIGAIGSSGASGATSG